MAHKYMYRAAFQTVETLFYGNGAVSLSPRVDWGIMLMDVDDSVVGTGNQRPCGMALVLVMYPYATLLECVGRSSERGWLTGGLAMRLLVVQVSWYL